MCFQGEDNKTLKLMIVKFKMKENKWMKITNSSNSIRNKLKSCRNTFKTYNSNCNKVTLKYKIKRERLIH